MLLPVRVEVVVVAKAALEQAMASAMVLAQKQMSTNWERVPDSTTVTVSSN
jgi:hypothetical protein